MISLSSTFIHSQLKSSFYSPIIFLVEYDTMSLIASVILGILLFTMLGLILVFIYLQHSLKKNETLVDNNIRMYTFSYKEKKVYSIDRKDLSNCKHYTYEEFFNEFEQSYKPKVEKWLFDYINNTTQSTYLEVKVKLTTSRKTRHLGKQRVALLEITSIDRKLGLVHLRSQLLPNVSEYNRKRNKHIKNHFVKFEDITSIVKKHSPSSSITIYNINIYSSLGVMKDGTKKSNTNFFNSLKSSKFNNSNKDIKFVRVQILNELFPLLNEEIYIAPYKEDNIVVLKLENYSASKVTKYAYTLLSNSNKYLKLNSLDDIYKLSIGIDTIPMREFNSKQHLENSYAASIIIRNKTAEADRIKIYDPDDNLLYYSEYKNMSLSSTIKNGMFNLYFNPCFDLSTGEIDFYYLEFESTSKVKATFNEVINYSLETAERTKDLFEALDKKLMSVIPNDVNRNAKILLTGDLNFLSTLISNSFVSSLSKLSVDFAFALEEEELEKMDQSELLTLLKSSNNTSIDLALIVSNQVLSLAKSLLEEFTYFLVPNEFSVNITKDVRIQTSTRLLLDSLKSYSKTIVMFNVLDMSSISYCLHLGINHFISPLIMKRSRNIEKISSENKYKIVRTFKVNADKQSKK